MTSYEQRKELSGEAAAWCFGGCLLLILGGVIYGLFV